MKQGVKRSVGALLALWLIFFCSLSVSAKERTLIAAGTAFGIRLRTDGALVAGMPAEDSPAAGSGLTRGDIIVSADGTPIASVSELLAAVERSEGREMTIDYRRGKLLHTVHVTPMADGAGSYRLGLWVKDSAAGIGTVTFIDPETLCFAGLGHGICDGAGGELVPFAAGTAEEVTLSGIVRGAPGEPGELRGYFAGKPLGTLSANRATGIYGTLDRVPPGLVGERFAVGNKNDVTEGRAYIFSTVDGEGRGMYEIEILNIDREASSRNFTVRVTDPRLIEKTGGIVQGMSGSPIFQNGKLIGAVTHVFVQDSAKGFGVFIEEMLKAGTGD